MFEPVYDRDGIQIYCGDCLEVMKQFPDKSFDLCLTDPPYGIKRDKGFEGFGGFGGFGEPIARRRFEDDEWDIKRPDKTYFEELLRLQKLSLIFGGNFFADLLPMGTHWLFWDKLQTMPTFGDGELIWTNSGRKSIKKIVFEWNGLIGKENDRYHPTQKPEGLILKLLQGYSECNQSVIDPFMGSGTTLVAAKKLGRRAVGIEISEKYCEIAIKRLEAIPPNLPFGEESR